MKKLLMGIFGLMLLLPLGVYAGGTDDIDAVIDSVEPGNNSIDTNVTVGEVDIPVYEATISWESMIFEWKFNGDNYQWMVAPICEVLYIENLEAYTANITSSGTLYSDASCSTVSESYNEETTAYYHEYTPTQGSSIYILDQTTNGKITPSVSWTSSSKYDYVDGKFSYNTKKCTLMTYDEVVISQFGTYTDSECKNEIPADEVINTYEPGKYYNYEYVYEKLNNQEIPDEGRLDFGSVKGYSITFKLENKETPTTTPTTGDTIGTITISIRAAE